MKRYLKIEPQFWTQARKVFHTAEHEVGGTYRNTDTFTLLSVPGAGHETFGENYNSGLQVLRDISQHGHLVCRDCDVTEAMCRKLSPTGGKPAAECDGTTGQLKCPADRTGFNCETQVSSVSYLKQ